MISNQNFIDNQELPIGFTMELSKQLGALDRFADMPKEQQDHIVAGARQVHSRNEMREYVSNIFKQ